MNRPYGILVYGSYGYTGALIVEKLRSSGIPVLLSGRDETKLRLQSVESGFPFKSCGIAAPGTVEFESLAAIVATADVVIHCAGPFSATARFMAEACMRARTHYLDITGEYGVFEALARLNDQAKECGVILMPGVGFDVVPTDCMARHLKEIMPEAHELVLAFASVPAGISRGTARTALQHSGEPMKVRRNGELCEVGPQPPELEINFGPFQRLAVGISWGDIVTAYHTTGIPNISVFLGVSERQRLRMRKLFKWGWLLRSKWLKNLLTLTLGKSGTGPSVKVLREGKTYIYGRVSDASGRCVERWLTTPNGYELTASAAVAIAIRVRVSENATGYHTPAGLFGASFVLELPGTVGFSDMAPAD